MLTNPNERYSLSNLRGAIKNICRAFVSAKQLLFFKVNVRGVSVSLLGVLGGLLPQYDLTAWETVRLGGKIFWRKFTNCDRRLKIQVHTATSKYK